MAPSRTGLILVSIALVTSSVLATAKDHQMPCDPNGECSDPCVYFPGGVVFVVTEQGAKLKYRGKVHNLFEKKVELVRKLQGFANLPGDIERRTYEGGTIRLVMTSKVLDTSCYEKNAKGEWESIEKCCSTSFDMKMNLQIGSISKPLNAKWEAGC